MPVIRWLPLACLLMASTSVAREGDHYLILNDEGYYVPVSWYAQSGNRIVFATSDAASLPVNPFQPEVETPHSGQAGAATTISAAASASGVAENGEGPARRLGRPTSAYSAWFVGGDAAHTEEYEVADSFVLRDAEATYLILTVTAESTTEDQQRALTVLERLDAAVSRP